MDAAALLVGAGGMGALALAAMLLRAPLALRTRAARAPPPPGPAARAAVVVPCRGHHQGFADNARALLSQDHPDHEVLFVLDEAGDPAHHVLRALRREPGLAPFRIVLSDPKAMGEDWPHGKVVALLSGARAAPPGAEVLVLADADIRPPRGWLRALAGPLADARVGAVTGYRWTHGASRASAWVALRDAWNGQVLDAMASPRHRFLWGGSLALRRRDLDDPAVLRALRTHFAEDVALTRAMRARGMGVCFAPGALAGSPEDATPAEARAWVVRQTALTLAAMPRLHRALALRHALAALLPPAGLAGLALPGSAPWAWPWLAPALALAAREALLLRHARRLLPSARARPRREAALQVLLAPLVPWLALWAAWRASRLQRIAWRGRTYRLAVLEPR